MHNELAVLHNKLFNVDFVLGMKDNNCKSHPDELHDCYNILASVI